MAPTSSGTTRRRFIQGSSAALAVARCGPLKAQTAPRHAVISLLGNRLGVVYAQMATGSRLDNNVQRIVDDPRGSMDQFALAAASQALGGAGHRGAALLSIPPSALHDKPDSFFDGGSVVLPANWVDAIEQSKAAQLLLLTKHRAPTSIPMYDGHLGVGMLSGLGYYVDIETRVRMLDSGQTGRGLLASYAYFKLTLADAHTGAVIKQRSCTGVQVYPVAASETAVDPWDVLPPAEKIGRLRSLLEEQIASEVPALLNA